MASVWYLGRSTIRSISVSEWAAAGVIGASNSVWDSANGYSLPTSGFTQQQLDILDNETEFDTSAPDGPRTSPVVTPSSQPITLEDVVELLNDSGLDQASLSATYASYINLAKNPDSITTGAVTLDANNLVTSAAVVWPDGKPGTLTITSRDANNAVMAYNITYGSPVIKTFTQPAITRNAAGAATNVPQIVVS